MIFLPPTVVVMSDTGKRLYQYDKKFISFCTTKALALVSNLKYTFVHSGGGDSSLSRELKIPEGAIRLYLVKVDNKFVKTNITVIISESSKQTKEDDTIHLVISPSSIDPFVLKVPDSIEDAENSNVLYYKKLGRKLFANNAAFEHRPHYSINGKHCANWGKSNSFSLDNMTVLYSLTGDYSSPTLTSGTSTENVQANPYVHYVMYTGRFIIIFLQDKVLVYESGEGKDWSLVSNKKLDRALFHQSVTGKISQIELYNIINYVKPSGKSITFPGWKQLGDGNYPTWAPWKYTGP